MDQHYFALWLGIRVEYNQDAGGVKNGGRGKGVETRDSAFGVCSPTPYVPSCLSVGRVPRACALTAVLFNKASELSVVGWLGNRIISSERRT
jgi:hypothetical protein